MLFSTACHSEMYFYIIAFPLIIKVGPTNLPEVAANGKLLKKCEDGSNFMKT